MARNRRRALNPTLDRKLQTIRAQLPAAHHVPYLDEIAAFGRDREDRENFSPRTACFDAGHVHRPDGTRDYDAEEGMELISRDFLESLKRDARRRRKRSE